LLLKVTHNICYMSSLSVSQKSTPRRVEITPKSTVSAKAQISVKPTTSLKTKVVPRETLVVAPAAKAVVQVAPANAVDVVPANEVDVAPVDSLESETSKVHIDAKKRRRPRLRAFADIYAQIVEDNNTSYKSAQAVNRTLKSLESAHNREVSSSKSRTNTTRTPTIVFDQMLVDYITSRLKPSDLTVNRKDGDTESVVDLSDLSTNTRVHRTDVTQLYNKIFIAHNMRNEEDRRFILYQNDKELVNLLTQGDYKPELEEDIQMIRDGTYKLTIFNIQRFTSHHVGKVVNVKE
jgi:hypothetical protein